VEHRRELREQLPRLFDVGDCVARAADVRDGLSRCTAACSTACTSWASSPASPYKKSARIVGDVMGKYHPHGDAAIYDTSGAHGAGLLPALPLVDGQGNFGSVDGDGAAPCDIPKPACCRWPPTCWRILTRRQLDFRRQLR